MRIINEKEEKQVQVSNDHRMIQVSGLYSARLSNQIIEFSRRFQNRLVVDISETPV